jgi:hypothetical protein
MGTRKTGKNVRIELEIGSVFYPWNALATVVSPAADVRKKYAALATFISGDKNRKPMVRLDGQVNGFTITPGKTYNEVDVSAGTGYLLGVELGVAATTVTDLERPIANATNVLWTALSVDSNGTINKTVGTEGTSTATRGAAGGPPFIPENEFLIGYVTMTYYGGSASGAKVVSASEINSDTKEYAAIPSYTVLYHDGGGTDPQNVGVVQFASQLPMIHGAGVGTATRNVFAQYHDAIFEELSDSYDFNITEDISVTESIAYRDAASQKDTNIPSWSVAGNVYSGDINDVLSIVKNKIRWMKHFPDADETPYRVGRGIWKRSTNFPVGETINSSVTIDGTGELYSKLL